MDGLLYAAQVAVAAGIPPSNFDLGKGGTLYVSTCSGDCDGNNTVSISEVQRCVNSFLGASLCAPQAGAANCPMADANNNGQVSISEIQQCVNRLLGGC